MVHIQLPSVTTAGGAAPEALAPPPPAAPPPPLPLPPGTTRCAEATAAARLASFSSRTCSRSELWEREEEGENRNRGLRGRCEVW